MHVGQVRICAALQLQEVAAVPSENEGNASAGGDEAGGSVLASPGNCFSRRETIDQADEGSDWSTNATYMNLSATTAVISSTTERRILRGDVLLHRGWASRTADVGILRELTSNRIKNHWVRRVHIF